MRHERKPDPLWHVQVAVIVALLLQILLPERLVFGPPWVMPILEALLLVGLSASTPKEPGVKSNWRRVLALSMVSLASIGNAGSLFLLATYLLQGGKAGGQPLLLAAINIFITNIIVFGLWYWELDGGGPAKRHAAEQSLPDFLFPQLNSPELCPTGWFPTFVDYLYVSSTNATAFSPTDTLPLTHRAKMLMLFQALISLITVALVAARAVNILS